MLTCGLVVWLDPDAPVDCDPLPEIRNEPAFTLGERAGNGMSVVLESRDPVESERWHDWVRRLPGVAGVEVVFVHWDDSKAEVPHAGV